MKKLFFSLILSLAVFTSVNADSNTTAGDLKLDITVNGLVCDFCARAVEKVFKKEFTVKSVDIDLSEKFVTVTLPAGTEISDEKVKKLVNDAGYAFVSVKRHEAKD